MIAWSNELPKLECIRSHSLQVNHSVQSSPASSGSFRVSYDLELNKANLTVQPATAGDLVVEETI